MTPVIRIWGALNSHLEGADMNIVQEVLQPDSKGDQNCDICLSEENHSRASSIMQKLISSQNLNESQEDAVVNCITMSKCHHNDAIKLIWGPPGTGKTKTVASLLFSQLKLKTRIVTCAPTNTAVLAVASRLHSIVKDSLDYETYGLGDIVLFGNRTRMKIDSHKGLEIFLDERVDDLLRCSYGWKSYMESMVALLKDPVQEYASYKRNFNENDKDVMSLDEFVKTNYSAVENAYRACMQRCKRRYLITLEQFLKKKHVHILEQYNVFKNDEKLTPSTVMTMEEFVKQRFCFIGGKLKGFMQTLYTHLPTAFIPLEVVKKIFIALDLMKSIEIFLDESKIMSFGWFGPKRVEFLSTLSSLSQCISLPNFGDRYSVIKFCLMNVCLVFCTASSSYKCYTKGMTKIQFLVIDEAAQLKECESAIPLQLPGLRRCILIGDERQLPALVKSKIAEKAEFGRSLFERLVLLGYKRHMLNVQYRMHPSISFIPK